MTPEIPFRRNVVEPVQCLKDGWEIIKNQYWLFVGMTFIAVLIGGAVPLGILLGPMMCGLHMTFFRARRGEAVEFGMLFKGFDYFGQSLIATLLYILPIVVVVVPVYVLFYVGMFVSMAAANAGDEPNPAAAFGFMGVFILVWAVILIVILIVSVCFTFAYPLIADRKLSGLDAVKLSFKAALANFWRLLGMMLLTGLLSMVGALACYVGMFLVMPIGYAAIAKAYEQVFGLSDGSDYSNLPPPPPIFSQER